MMLALLLAAAAQHAPSQHVAAQFVGTWRLVSATQTMADGSERADPDLGPHPRGYITYTAAGQMCTMIGSGDRPRWADGAHPTPAEASGIFANMVAYCGTYTVDEAAGVVVHHVELDLSPNRIGTDRKRPFKLSGDRLELHPAPPWPAGVTDWTVSWQRVR
jgi:hypothetical protein